MFLLKLLRYIKSYVRFNVTGGFFEKFINMCVRAGIPLWDISPTSEGVTASTTAASYKKLRPIARKTGSRIKAQERHGIKFKIKKYQKRKGLFIGLVCFFAFFVVMSNFIWKIEVVGTEKLTDKQVIGYLKEYGVHPGTYKRGVDTQLVEQKMMLALDDIAWIAVNIRGSTAEIEILERTPPPEMIEDPNRPSNVVAAETGQIKRMEVYDGAVIITEGNTVLKGDIIVSGIMETQKGITVLKPARAKVMAVVNRELEVRVELDQVSYTPTGKTKTKRAFWILGFRVPLSLPGGTGEYFNRYTAEKQLEVGEMSLPFALELTKYEELERTLEEFTSEQAQAAALDELAVLEKQNFPDCEVLTKDMTYVIEDNCYVLTANYTVYKDIAEVKYIEVD